MVDKENRGPELQAVVSTMVSLAFTATALRVYVRSCLVKAFGWDDAFMVFALLSHIVFATCAIGGIHWGTGRHMDILSNKEIFMAMRYWWLCYIGYCWAMITSKISIGLFLLRVTVKPIHKWILYCAMGLTVFTGLVFFFVTLLQCSPISYFWDKSSGTGSCVPIDVIIALTFLYSACAIISDFTFAILPFFLVWGLNMPVKTRVLLIPVLGMACIASIAVTVRLGYVMDFKNPDFLYATVDVAIWSDIEQGLAITAGSLATLRPLYRQVADRLGLSTGGTEDKNSKPSGMRTPQWSPRMSAPTSRNKFPSFMSLLRSEKGTVRDKDEEYGMGDLQPVRLRDDLVDRGMSEKSNDKSFTTWQIQGGKTSDEEHRAGAITMHTQVHQASERR
ncbi:hypothetical protein EK21DRAFT_60357 [Setomelanomma holmii]|uniref:Rhodopsin domain-containing protein n=1 Tax=Setomelanomma holmii TaxID=210430 RepID=A0A9P4LQE6_9PLEO|nr:hypothetical protein EK21DRAFT_60357 [Setomelanomma holmii]